jgi:hypothetical protein
MGFGLVLGPLALVRAPGGRGDELGKRENGGSRGVGGLVRNAARRAAPLPPAFSVPFIRRPTQSSHPVGAPPRAYAAVAAPGPPIGLRRAPARGPRAAPRPPRPAPPPRSPPRVPGQAAPARALGAPTARPRARGRTAPLREARDAVCVARPPGARGGRPAAPPRRGVGGRRARPTHPGGPAPAGARPCGGRGPPLRRVPGHGECGREAIARGGGGGGAGACAGFMAARAGAGGGGGRHRGPAGRQCRSGRPASRRAGTTRH